jgi:hypothetical protein
MVVVVRTQTQTKPTNATNNIKHSYQLANDSKRSTTNNRRTQKQPTTTNQPRQKSFCFQSVEGRDDTIAYRHESAELFWTELAVIICSPVH